MHPIELPIITQHPRQLRPCIDIRPIHTSLTVDLHRHLPHHARPHIVQCSASALHLPHSLPIPIIPIDIVPSTPYLLLPAMRSMTVCTRLSISSGDGS